MIVLSTVSQRELIDALAEAFTPEDLIHKVVEPLGVPVHARSEARDVRERAAAVVQWAVGSDRIADLLTHALRGNPSNLRLRRLHEATGLLPATSELIEVMRAVLPPGGDEVWLRCLAEAQRQVCGIRVERSRRLTEGTGFLVGPDQIMTHARVLGGDLANAHPDQVQIEFEDVTVHLADAPVVVAANDVVVLRLERAAGRELAPTSGQIAARARGWIAPSPREPRASGPLVVVQFVGHAVTVAADPAGYLGSSGDSFSHRAATHPGSLGAPCFDERWRLVGMHLSGQAGNNEGRTVEAITAGLRREGFGWDLSRGVFHRTRSLPPDPPISAPRDTLDDLVRGIASTLDTGDDDAWSAEAEDLGLAPDDRWPWAEAAAVHATFDPRTLVPFGAAPDRARAALLLDSRPVPGTERWAPVDRLRFHALRRLAMRGNFVLAREVNPTDTTDPVDVMLGQLIAGQSPEIADPRDPDALRALLVAVEWLAEAAGCLGGVEPHPMPDRAELRAALERAMLLAPFRNLTRGFFVNRDEELGRLRRHADRGGGLPLFVFGPGGMGKSALLARFLLTRSDHDPMNPSAWQSFVYLDFDRPELDAIDLGAVLLAMVRPIGPQLPALAADAQGLLERWSQQSRRPERSRRPSDRQRSLRVAPADLPEVLKDVAALLGRAGPLVLILDTLEEVQFASPDAIEPLIELVGRLARAAPNVRPILAGRIDVHTGVELMELRDLPAAAAEALLGNELPPALAARTDLVARLVEIVGGNPLSLRLAAEVLRREAEHAPEAIAELDAELRQRVGDAILQGRLYERILGHIHDPGVRALAYPGLVLRRISWQLIRDVLAIPCGLGARDETAARTLFAILAREVALVRRRGGGDELELRPELRRIVRKDFARDARSTAQRIAIHTAAVAFYAQRDTPADRAEEIYHRLALGEDPDAVDRRWLTGVEELLRDAVDELPPPAAAYLANRVGGLVDAAQIALAGPADWEAWAWKRASDLLQFGSPEKALEILAGRSERLPTSRLYHVEAVARRMLPAPELAAAEAAAEQAVAAARASSNADHVRASLEELVQIRRLRGDHAGVLRALAELANLGDVLGDDLVVLQSSVESLESFSPLEPREEFTRTAVRVFNRLPDELVTRSPELARRVAAQVGAFDPATLKRVISLVGTGSLDDRAALGLRDVLDRWGQRSPEIASFVPRAGTSPRELASTVRYLISSRELDTETAAELASWLGTVAPPPSVLVGDAGA